MSQHQIEAKSKRNQNYFWTIFKVVIFSLTRVSNKFFRFGLFLFIKYWIFSIFKGSHVTKINDYEITILWNSCHRQHWNWYIGKVLFDLFGIRRPVIDTIRDIFWNWYISCQVSNIAQCHQEHCFQCCYKRAHRTIRTGRLEIGSKWALTF